MKYMKTAKDQVLNEYKGMHKIQEKLQINLQ